MFRIPTSAVPNYETLQVGDTIVYCGIEFIVINVSKNEKIAQSTEPLKMPIFINKESSLWKDSPWRNVLQNYFKGE